MFISQRLSRRTLRNASNNSRSTASERSGVSHGGLEDLVRMDESLRKSYGRQLASYLEKFSFYYPNHTEDTYSNPSLLKMGWAFYDHLTLARHKIDDSNMKRTEPGNPDSVANSQLYSFWKTPGRRLDEIGIGVGLYFNTIRFMSLIMLLVYVLSIYNVYYYTSEEYGGENHDRSGVALPLLGSALCNQKTNVTCESEEWCHRPSMTDAGITWFAKNDDDNTTLVEKVDCNGPTLTSGIFVLASFVIALLSTMIFIWFQEQKQVIDDENHITATDYSVIVTNPPKDAKDANEWCEFFEQFDEKGVTCVTILINNATLLRNLLVKRFLRKEIQRMLPNDTDFNDKEALNLAIAIKEVEIKNKPLSFRTLVKKCCRPFGKPFNRLLNPKEVMTKISQFDKKIQPLLLESYEVTDVIVTFETESGQRNALKALSRSKLDYIQNNTQGDDSTTFKGVLLEVSEPAEPSAIRYLEIDTNVYKTTIQSAITLSITVALIALGGLLQNIVRKGYGPFVAGLLTSTLNMLVPIIIKLLMMIEKHDYEDNRQKSLYLKVTLFRWVNTAVTVKFVTPFTSTLTSGSSDLLSSISGILVSEIFFVPLLSILDIVGNVSKHYFAPRAKTIQQMLLCFKGTEYNLADKYTDITKIVFISYYYSVLNPNFLLMGFVALSIRYYSDKFCLLRIWYAAPYMGDALASFSRWFFVFAIVAGIAVSAYDLALFNFDRVCIGETDDTFRVCSEDKGCCQSIGFKWPPIPARFESADFSWMSEEQQDLSYIYGYFSLGIVVSFFVIVFGGSIIKQIISLVRPTYQPRGKDQQVDFSNVTDIDGYVPQVRNRGFGSVFPIIACNISDVHVSLIGWNDPNTQFTSRGYDRHNLIYDLDDPGSRSVFSTMHHWPGGNKTNR